MAETAVATIKNHALTQSLTASGALPKCLVEEQTIPGYNRKQWVPRTIEEHEKPDVERQLLQIEARLKPAPREVILALIGRAMVHDQKKRTAEEIAAMTSDYADDLSDASEPHIAHAIRDHRKTSNWFPTIAELRELILTRQSFASVMRNRAQLLLGLRDPTNWEISLVEKAKAEIERRKALSEERESKLAGLTPALAATARSLMDAAGRNEKAQNRA